MPRKKKDPEIRVRVIALLEEPHLGSPVVVLHDPETDRILPIWIGEIEARAIAMILQGVKVSRPLTHTLVWTAVRELGGKMDRVVIDEIEGGTYFAVIYMNKGRQKLSLDSRPSDAVAIGLETDSPIYVNKSVMDTGGQENPFPSEDIVDAEKRKKIQKMPEFSEDEVKQLKKLLKKAREREQGDN